MRYLIALLFLLSFISSQAQDKELFYKKASDFADKKDYENALKQIDLALYLDSTNSDFLFLKANTLYELKEYKVAFTTYSTLITHYPLNVLALNQRGILLNTVQEFEYAITDFDKALSICKIDSIRMTLFVNRGAAKISIREFQGAYNDFMEAYKIDSMQIGVLNNLATVMDEIGKGDQTLKYLFKILEIDSNFIGAYANIGFKYQQMGKYKMAVKFFDKVLSLDSNEALTYNNRGFNRLKLGDLNGAMSDVEKSIELYPGNSYAYRNRALVYLAQKNIKNACVDLDKALELGFTKMYGNEVEELKLKNCYQYKQ